jgi:hypothetical protein
MMNILATDLDRTLLPNGEWSADPGAIDLFNQLTEQHDVLVVYVTGRNLDLTEQAIVQYGVRHPDVLVGDVGTSIRSFSDGRWQFDHGWSDKLRQLSPRWNNEAIRAAVVGVTGIRQQEPEHLNEFKQSYYVDHAHRDEILQQVEQRLKGRFDEVIIYSYDSVADKGLLDLQPNSATKLTALEYVAEKHGLTPDQVVFCGDSGNDIFPLTAGFNGVLVRNADEQLVTNVHQALAQNPALNLYFATGEFKGLNGYYTSGVIEGAFHYGIFSDRD